MEGQHAGDHVLRQRRQVQLGGGQVGVAQHPLHVGQRHLRITRHPVGGRVPQVVQRPVRSQHRAGPGEHPVRGVIGQRPERAAQRPPQRLVPAGWHQPGHLRLIQPQPHERVRRGRDRLQRPGALADHGDQLLARVGISLGGAEQLRRAHPGRHPERHQRPVPVRAQRREQLAELLIRDLPRPAPGQLRPVQPARSARNGSIGFRCAPARLPRPRASGNGFTIGPVPACRWYS